MFINNMTVSTSVSLCGNVMTRYISECDIIRLSYYTVCDCTENVEYYSIGV